MRYRNEQEIASILAFPYGEVNKNTKLVVLANEHTLIFLLCILLLMFRVKCINPDFINIPQIGNAIEIL